MKHFLKNNQGQDFHCYEFFVEPLEAFDIAKEGTIEFVVKHPHSDWKSNKNIYEFPVFSERGLWGKSLKNREGIFFLIVNGPLKQHWVFKHDISRFSEGEMHVAVSWKDNWIKFFLDGKLLDDKTIA